MYFVYECIFDKYIYFLSLFQTIKRPAQIYKPNLYIHTHIYTFFSRCLLPNSPPCGLHQKKRRVGLDRDFAHSPSATATHITIFRRRLRHFNFAAVMNVIKYKSFIFRILFLERARVVIYI